MRALEFITETTSAGGIAPVAMPMGAVVKREVDEDLKKWFREKWVRFGPDGKIRGDCARVKVKNPAYSMGIDVAIFAKSPIMARLLLKAQYGEDSLVTNVRRLV